MPLLRLRGLGNEVSLFASDEMLSADLTVRNSLWRWFYSNLLRPLASIPRRLFGESRPVTVTDPSRPKAKYTGRSVVEVDQDAPAEAHQLAQEASGIVWYHTFDLGHGIVTPGQFDHAPIIEHYRLPDRLDGKRVLDVACFDGFWSMEFERRGAAEVVALDINQARELDLPPVVRQGMSEEELNRPMGNGFRLVHRAKQSRVERVHCNVYDLSPDLRGMFDISHIGDVLLHLQNPAKALANICRVTKEYTIVSDIFDPRLDREGTYPLTEFRGGREDCVWWYFSFGALEQMIRDAGFRRVELLTRFKYGTRGSRQQMWHAVFKAWV
jgi:tRNA (mo5U34)-methyltransferase